MGSLAKLVWLRLAGTEWEREGRHFHCTGHWQGYPCWDRAGHGEVDLGGAMKVSCNLAFLAWARERVAAWTQDMGVSATRAKVEAAFKPFLGDRLTPGDVLPELSPQWVGDGDLLRTSPEAFARWLDEPGQAEVRALGARYLRDAVAKGWWIKTGTGPVVGHVAGEDGTGAWSAGGDGNRVLVIHLARGHGKVEGIARFREVAPR